MRIRATHLTCLALAANLLAGCGPDEPTTRVAKAPSERAIPGISSFERFASRAEVMRSREDRGGASQESFEDLIAWSLPEGWEQLPSRQFRTPNLRVKAHPEAECYLTLLEGDGGGPLANVNRWRGQVGLGPIDEAQLAELERVDYFGTKAPFVDVTGDFRDMDGDTVHDDARLFAVFLNAPMATVTVKMTGPADVLGEERGRFLEFCASLTMKPRDASGHAAHAGPMQGAPGPAGDSAPSSSGPLRFSLPTGWQSQGSSGMRMASIKIGSGTDLSVIRAGGTLADNVNRWRGQLGAAPLDGAEVASLARVTGAQGELVLVEVEGTYTGMQNSANEAGYALLGAIDEARGLFVKMIGPASEVSAERANFMAFVQTLEEVN